MKVDAKSLNNRLNRTQFEINIPSDFGQVKEKGYTFGASREVYKRVFTKNQPFIQDPDIPGPGTYQVPTFVERIKNDKRNFIMGGKNEYELRKYFKD